MSIPYVGDSPWIHMDVFQKRMYDEMTGSEPQFWRGADWWINACSFSDASNLIYPTSNWHELYLSIFPYNAPLLASAIFKLTADSTGSHSEGTIYSDCTLATWQNRTKRQVQFYVVNTKTGGTTLAAGKYTMVIHGDSSDDTKIFVLGKCNITVIEAGL